ncbi:Uu.00g123850.m01.CDS01 [Anthostomella pinea]|uniref:Uu.00g123850.m01.CDS01 n=1 Tax=Anthostomella pinea TaxID=933095 RepID=A0AAI8VI55_9PEZI|nr:Uu.00g123850.m01.CDS01 [Anthostomella pinea]
MPVISPTTPINTFVDRDTITNSTNATVADALQVVCAWPVSGQYGAGSRVLYYILVAVCVFARKAEWLRSAGLAAALLVPAVAALHAIVLAAVHVDGAVDMDVYGAFQLCSIGILAAPVTVRLSQTYFNDPGRNMIFLWTGLVLAGLLSLTVEFYRIETFACSMDDFGQPMSSDPSQFNYMNAGCGLALPCNTGPAGPFSPLRRGATNEIFVIPAPDRLTFNAATLVAAACCVPAILSLIYTWIKILEVNWKNSYGHHDEPISGTNGATIGKMKGVNAVIRTFLSTVEVPLFGGAVIVILVFGELNFFSRQVNFQTEPMTSIGRELNRNDANKKPLSTWVKTA